MDVAHRVSGRSYCPPALGDRLLQAGLEPGRVHWGLTLAKTVWVQPGDVHFSHDYCHPSIPHPIPLQWSGQTERALIQQKQKQNWRYSWIAPSIRSMSTIEGVPQNVKGASERIFHVPMAEKSIRVCRTNHRSETHEMHRISVLESIPKS